jgi:phosphatidylethanolamine/phosphatidyl-N-methylethanolamine N-methyltransferase
MKTLPFFFQPAGQPDPKRTTGKTRRSAANVGLFLRRWLAHPLQMGSVVPSSPALCDRLVRLARPMPGRIVLELGAGTGMISQALLAAGLAPEHLIVVEIDPGLVAHLRRTLPGSCVIAGDARRLPELLPERFLGRIGSVICGIPLVLLPRVEQKQVIDAISAVAPGRGFRHFSYCMTSPLPAAQHGLRVAREAWVPLNFPPASIWHYH